MKINNELQAASIENISAAEPNWSLALSVRNVRRQQLASKGPSSISDDSDDGGDGGGGDGGDGGGGDGSDGGSDGSS